ncbi:PLP-dependent aminotransferase family protein [Acinetobacter sp. MD2]|uniref:aminotransferase-like domain-containing protein n=1 Tax=Acinetobacter sp. MD2 TaxID=2600066 RepID=UPI002D1F6D12|nr:PLP-dependent aminotransferase family protein [Acinetobacter sp. MD2]MEB3766427.1 PLP-dependent aminotransferase family protein [Acinetobacter sp. MD2]
MYKSKQLAQKLEQQIQNGVWDCHQKLPSLREQAQRSGFSLMTVRNAYQTLEAQGLIYAKEKSGYFISANTTLKPSANLNQKIQINSKIFQYLKATQQPDIIGFGSAFPDSRLLYAPKFLQMMAQHARHPARYNPMDSLPPGQLALREKIAQRYRMQGVATSADDIVITSGGLDALNLALQSVAKAGDYILLQQTIFYGAWQAAERLGLNVITIPEHPHDGFDLEAFRTALNTYPIKVCWFMLNSHNPIGFTVNEGIKLKISQILQQHQVYLIEDDVYEELYYGHTKPRAMKYYDQDNWVLHCASFSKTLGADCRIGWIHAGKFSNTIQHLQLMSTLSANNLIQHTLVDFLSGHHYEQHLRQLKRRLESRKKQFYSFLVQHLPNNCEVFYYPSGYFLWIQLPEHLNSMYIYQYLLQFKISIAPAQLFNLLNPQQHFLRINCSFEWSAHIEEALTLLVQSIQNYSTLVELSGSSLQAP